MNASTQLQDVRRQRQNAWQDRNDRIRTELAERAESEARQLEQDEQRHAESRERYRVESLLE